MERIVLNNLPDSNALWKGIGGYFDSLGEILCEFIDNSISNFAANNSDNRTIVIEFKENRKTIRNKEHITYSVRVIDTGTGIIKLQESFTLGCTIARETPLNEHGFGFKHALASANPSNDCWSISTRTTDDAKKNVFKKITAPYSLNGMEVTIVSGNWKSSLSNTGTIIEFNCSCEMFNTCHRGLRGNYSTIKSNLEVLKEDLGFIYSGVLAQNGVHLLLKEIGNNDSVVNSITVTPIKPEFEGYYVAPVSNEKVDLGGGLVDIDYVFGSMLESSNRKYYKRNQESSGAEIRINGRLLTYNVFKQIWKKEQHPSFNQFLVLIDIKSNDSSRLPTTKTAKNGLREGDSKLEFLFNWIQAKMPNPPTASQIINEDYNERQMFQILAENLKKYSIGGQTPIINLEQYAYSSLDERVRIDLYYNRGNEILIFEGKKEETTVKDVYQLLMYWDGLVYDGIKPSTGILISKRHPDSVAKIVDVINGKMDQNSNKYKIELKKWEDFGFENK